MYLTFPISQKNAPHFSPLVHQSLVLLSCPVGAYPMGAASMIEKGDAVLMTV